MIRVTPGIFIMGAPNMPPPAEPFEGLRTVEMDKVFYLGEVEVSQAFWSRHMKINPSRFQSPSTAVEGLPGKGSNGFCETLNLDKEKFKARRNGLPIAKRSRMGMARAGSKTTFSLAIIRNH